ncbi:MAG: metal-dependent hydrolase [Candidatus Binatia bacterium]
MPSAITHAMVGAALAPLAPRPLRRAGLAVALAAVAVLPDADVLAFRFGIPYTHPLGHRGISHSLFFAALVALVLARAFYPSAQLGARRRCALAVLLFAAAASHGLLDACTNGGSGVAFFLPFSEARVFFPWRPIAVSPLSARTFFSDRGWAILRSEAAWVWLPTALALAAVLAARRWMIERSLER